MSEKIEDNQNLENIQTTNQEEENLDNKENDNDNDKDNQINLDTPDKTTTDMVQLIYFDLSYNENFENEIQSSHFSTLGKNYNTVSIIGCQSSGKSTLLNNLFQTNFEVMSDDKGRGQTTKGIWSSLCTKNKILILDVEGTDSKERGDDRHKFENCSSLFGLALADLLLVNMWTVDIGRYTASNYGVLKTIFEMNLKLFQQECAKKIIFVLRDFNLENDNKAKITDLIMKDIYNIWADIQKPEKYKDYTPDKFFEFEFITLPHYFYNSQEFDNEIVDLRSRFCKDSNRYLFSHSNQENNVPSQDLNIYFSKIWSTILGDKDLNIPNEKEMLARFKCNEIKNSSLKLVERKIDNLILDSDSREIPSAEFVSISKEIIKEAVDDYTSCAKQYLHHIYDSVKKELNENIASKLNVSFSNQAKKFIPKSQKEMRSELEEAVKEEDNFNKCSLRIKNKYLQNLTNKLEKIKVFDSWEITSNEYEELFNEIIENQRKSCIEEKQNETIKKLRRLIEEFLFVKMEDLSLDFWDEFNQEYFSYMHSVVFSLETFFNEFYGMPKNEFIEIAQNIEIEMYNICKKDLLKKLFDLHNTAYDIFRKNFWYDEGLPRVWNKTEANLIKELKAKYISENEFIFKLFYQFKLLRNPLSYMNYVKPEEESLCEFIKEIPEIIKKEEEFMSLLSNTEIGDLKSRYMEKVEELFDDAIRRHENIVQQQMPIWVWILILYVGYEDVLSFFKGYWYIPVILILTVYGTLKALHLEHMPKQLFDQLKTILKLQGAINQKSN